MSSASRDKIGWIAQFRPLAAPRRRGSQKKLRIPPRFITGPDERAAALAFASMCEEYCRVLEQDPDPLTIRKALELRVISEEQAADLREGRGARPPVDPIARLTIEDAWQLHPSTQREDQGAPAEYERHLRNLRRFTEWSGIKYVDEVNLGHVQDWIAHLKGLRMKFDTRRHLLIPLRRATRMAATRGFPDVIGGLILDRREEEPLREVTILPMKTLVEAARRLQEAGNHRMLAAVALGAFLGLRPSEIQRLRAVDVDEAAKALQVGARQAKNRSSRRLLPLPEIMLEILRPLPEDPQTPLIVGSRGQMMERTQLSREIQAAVGAEAKTLRKSFTTWAHRRRPRLDPELVEAWVGHTSSRVARISARHYMADALLQDLEPIAEAIETLIASTPGATHSRG